MHEGLGRTWREVADHHHAELLTELAAAFDAQMNEAVFEAVAEERRQGDARTEEMRARTQSETSERIRRSVSDQLNQTLRRLRQSPSQAGVLTLLAEATGPWTPAAIVALGEDNQVRSVASRGLKQSASIETVSLDDAPAIRSVMDNAEPVVAAASASEVSAALADALRVCDKCHLLPVVVRGESVAILIAGGEVLSGALELLTEAAGLRLEALEPIVPPALKPLPSPGLVQIAPSAPAPPASKEPPQPGARWEDLSPAEQSAHLHAQRKARVHVAEIRLYNADALRQGVFAGDIYKHLREQIDKARADFLQNCLAQSPTLVDYLHLEILRSLAHDDERLLGSDYPGPMV